MQSVLQPSARNQICADGESEFNAQIKTEVQLLSGEAGPSIPVQAGSALWRGSKNPVTFHSKLGDLSA